jgi:hypothetical protein
MGAVFGDDQRLRFGQIDDLTGNEAGCPTGQVPEGGLASLSGPPQPAQFGG